jgi:serine/threonine-protein kinase
MATLREELQASLGSAYTIERELGGGGMSRVFLAEETRLRRNVVVKVLTPELAAGVSAERFEREIMVAARLVHPSIVPVLAAGDANGLPYYTMPFVDGESLRARLSRQGPLPISEAASLLRDVARALAHAHERGIVHRDIKPENVLLAGGAAVVTDFGIAKAISAARGVTSDATLTSAGTSIGTPAYMAPEQITGDPATGIRADFYSFGCLAYELLTGETPFHNRPMHRLLAAHLSEAPPDLLQRRPDCPAPLARLVMQCLEKDPELRPHSAGDLVRVLETAATPSGERVTVAGAAPRRLLLTRAPAFILGALVVLVGAWILVQRRGPHPAPAPEVGALRSIAVLPFANVGGDTADAYFADGIGEELATALSKVAGLRVVARNSTFGSGGRPIDESEAGRTLGVDALLAGSVRRAGPQLRLTARLVRVSDGSLVWSEQYEREVKDVFAVQDEVARAIVVALQLQLAASGRPPSGSAGQGPAERGTSNLEAYDLYLRGQFNLHRRNVPAAVENFQRAIELDRVYARAYSGLSAALELLPYFGGIPADSVRESAITAARRALALDSTLAEAHTSMALAYMHANQWSESELEHRRAIALDPGDAAAHVQYGRMLLATGRFPDANSEFERAESLDPFSPVGVAWISTMALLSGQKEAALAAARRAVALDSTTGPALNALTRALLAAGQAESAMVVADRLPRVPPWAGIKAYVHAKAGDPETARRIVREIEARRSLPWAGWFTISWARLGLGDTAQALDALERSTDAHEIWPSWFTLFDGVYKDVLASPRFAAMARRVGLDVGRFAAPRSAGPR